MLRTIAFQDYFAEQHGNFQLSGGCLPAFARAYFLYALDIRPGQGVLAQCLRTDCVDPVKTNMISLEIEGEALCHIINLYRLYYKSTPSRFTSVDLPKVPSYRMPFGTLSVRRDHNIFVCSFEPGTFKELSEPRAPFSSSCGYPWTTDTKGINLDPAVVDIEYFQALHHGISKSNAIRPSASTPQRTGSKLS